MFSNLSINKRLIFGFFTLIVLLLLSNVLGLFNMSRIMDDLRDVTDKCWPKIKMSHNIYTYAVTADQAMRELLLVDSPDEHEKIKAKIEETRKKYMAELEKLGRAVNTPIGMQLFKKTQESRSALQSIYPRLYDAIEKDHEAAKRILFTEYSPGIKKLTDSVQGMIGWQVEKLNETKVRSGEFYSQTVNLSIVLLTCGILIATVFAFWLIRSITKPLSRIQMVMLDAHDHNDFSQTVPVKSKDEVGQMSMAFNELMSTLRQTFTHLKKSAVEVDSAGESLVIASDRSAKASSLTNEAAASMAASVEEMSVSINQVSDNAKTASDIAHKAGNLSGEGGEVIANTVNEMRQIADNIDHVADAIGELGQQSDQISSIIQVIKEVADQTNLLALNAAIEAARAGEAGRGFAVVADEVRKLAERTTKATGEISSMIGGIQSSSQSAVEAMQKTVEQMKTGREMAEQAGKAIIEIRQAASDVVHVVEDIATSIAEQSTASQSIAQQLEHVTEAAEENSSASTETLDSAHRLEDLAKNMQETTDKFKI